MKVVSLNILVSVWLIQKAIFVKKKLKKKLFLLDFFKKSICF